MSDSSQGPGWWLASDGRWYPPEQATTSPQPPGAPMPPGAEAPRGPGWWQASDGNWYPPQPGYSGGAEPNKPVYKRVWFWLLVVVALGIGGCGAIAGVVGVAVDHVAHEKHTIVYSVTGAGQAATITYDTLQEGSGQNGNIQVADVALPWSRTVTASGLITIFHVSAVVGEGGGSVTCSITDNGAMVAQHTATGALAAANCTWGE